MERGSSEEVCNICAEVKRPDAGISHRTLVSGGALQGNSQGIFCSDCHKDLPSLVPSELREHLFVHRTLISHGRMGTGFLFLMASLSFGLEPSESIPFLPLALRGACGKYTHNDLMSVPRVRRSASRCWKATAISTTEKAQHFTNKDTHISAKVRDKSSG